MRSSCKVIKLPSESNEQFFVSPIPIHMESDNTDENIEKQEMEEEQKELKQRKVNEEVKKAEEVILKSAKEKSKSILDDAKVKSDALIKRSQDILNEANSESKNILKDAKDSGYQEGYKKGYTEGYKKGEDESESDYEKLIKSGNEYVYSTKEEADSYIKKMKNKIIELSVEIARNIIKADIAIDENAIFKIAEKVISSSVDRKQIILRVNPEDYKILKNRKDDFNIYVEKSDDLFLAADDRISRGDIKAETQSGFVDGGIEVQLQNILASLTGEK